MKKLESLIYAIKYELLSRKNKKIEFYREIMNGTELT